MIRNVESKGKQIQLAIAFRECSAIFLLCQTNRDGSGGDVRKHGGCQWHFSDWLMTGLSAFQEFGQCTC